MDAAGTLEMHEILPELWPELDATYFGSPLIALGECPEPEPERRPTSRPAEEEEEEADCLTPSAIRSSGQPPPPSLMDQRNDSGVFERPSSPRALPTDSCEMFAPARPTESPPPPRRPAVLVSKQGDAFRVSDASSSAAIVEFLEAELRAQAGAGCVPPATPRVLLPFSSESVRKAAAMLEAAAGGAPEPLEAPQLQLPHDGKRKRDTVSPVTPAEQGIQLLPATKHPRMLGVAPAPTRELVVLNPLFRPPAEV